MIRLKIRGRTEPHLGGDTVDQRFGTVAES
jgi:hypothetical protein